MATEPERPPFVGASVHYMAGATDVAAMITHADYRTSMPAGALIINPTVYAPKQALIAWPPMGAPIFVSALFDEHFAPNTWHWPSAHDPDPVPPPIIVQQPFIGRIVHYSQLPIMHLAGIILAVYDPNTVDLAVLTVEKLKVVWTLYQRVSQHTPPSDGTWHFMTQEETTEPMIWSAFLAAQQEEITNVA